MRSHVAYYGSTGEVHKVSYINEEFIEENRPDNHAHRLLPRAMLPLDIYVSVYTGEVVQRPVMGLAQDKQAVGLGEEVTFSNIPAGTVVTHPDGETVVDDGFLQWSCTVPGKYVFRFNNFPYKPEVLRVQVSA